MKKTIIAYTVIFVVFGILLYFLSMSWMNFLFKPNISKELEIFLSEVPRQHPMATQNQLDEFTVSLEKVLKEIGLFTNHFDYYEKLAPAFTVFKDTFTYLDFWEGALHSSSVLPILFKYREGKMIIQESIGNILPSGSIISAINERPIDEIMTFFGQFIYAETEEEKGFWVAERELMNYYPGFFNASNYQIEYLYQGEQYLETVKKIPWKEYASWKKRIESSWYELKKEGPLTVLKIYDLSYSEEHTHELREVMEGILSSETPNLMVDLTDTKGEGGNYYKLQLLLSYLTDKEDYLIQKQMTTYNKQNKAFSVIPQEETFRGNLYFLISEYSVYPYIRALIWFCRNTKTGFFIGEKPLSYGDYYSNPNQSPLYMSYLIPKVSRTLNAVEVGEFEGILLKSISFNLTDYLELMSFEKEYSLYLF